MLPDYLREGLEIVFIGLNPGTYSDQRGHYFARSTNLFWRALYESKIVKKELSPQDDVRMNDFGLGLTDLVARVTPNIDSLTRDEFVAGGEMLRAKIEMYAPRIACFVGITGFRHAFNPRAKFGAQSSPAWGKTKLFIVPSTSPRNAYYRPQVIDWFKKLKQFHDSIR
ncbi:MAG: mismatch-specific DNA-glycosylase [Chloroflexota bacterium]|nr:MAG: mismatch-specific DNA-glycosylase [Chloroflexota bacterium]